jgi:hypothetical protein
MLAAEEKGGEKKLPSNAHPTVTCLSFFAAEKYAAICAQNTISSFFASFHSQRSVTWDPAIPLVA